MQVRPRGVAAITAILFVLCGVLAMRHEAATPHVRTASGAWVHGRELSSVHASRDSDVHGQRNPDADAGECAVLTASHQAASAEVAAPAVIAQAVALHAPQARPLQVAAAHAAVYRLAPKTSPPLV
jgi:hypothetical protein